MTTEIESLLERCRKATGPDREIDRDLSVLPGAPNFVRKTESRVAYFRRADTDEKGSTIAFACGPLGSRFEDLNETAWPNYTASIDAALALIERVLPGCEYEITNIYRVAMVSLPLNTSMVMGPQTARREDCNVPLALLEALLLALLHQASDKGTANV